MVKRQPEEPFVTWQDFLYAGDRFAGFYGAGTHFAHPDALGSSAHTTDNTGAEIQDEVFHPFGGRWQAPYIEDERFAGLERRDSESGLDPTPNRMFTSGLGRWMTPDPMGGNITNPQSLNRYAYVLNNPTTLTDPLGLNQDCSYAVVGTSFGEVDNVNCPPDRDTVGYSPGGCSPIYVNDGYAGSTCGSGPGSLYGRRGGGGGAGGGAASTSSPFGVNTTTHSCEGQARVLEGNPKTIGMQGGVPGVPIAAGSAAATPSQWGFSSGSGFSNLSVSGTTNVAIKAPLAWVYFPNLNTNPTGAQQHFSGVTDVNGGKTPAGYANVREFLMSRFPGSLILELVSGKDQNVTTVRLNIPVGQGCPTGTVDSNALQIRPNPFK